MTAPTQAFPPWLSPVPVTLTQDGTAVVQTTVVQFPQTYYGPSIPLGPGWVFGGSTFPASIATSLASSMPSTASTSTSFPSQTATSSSSTSSSINASTTSSRTSLSSSASPSSSALATASHGLSSGARLAIILSTVLGTIAMVALVVVLCLIRRRRRENRATPGGRVNFSNWQLVNPSATQQPIETAAEDGEAASFITGGPSSMAQNSRGPTLSHAGSNWSQQVGEPRALARSTSGSGSWAAKTDTSTLDSTAKREALTHLNASGSSVAAGSLFFNPLREDGRGNGVRRSDEELVEGEGTSLTAGAVASSSKTYSARPPGAGPPHILTHPLPTDPQYNLVYPTSPDDDEPEEQFRPPRPLDPDRVLHLQNAQPSSGSGASWVYPDSPPSETDERAALLTARRVNVRSASDPVLPSSPSEKGKNLEDWTISLSGDLHDHMAGTHTSPGTWSNSMGGLTGFAGRLSRLSWFRRMEAHIGRGSTRHSSPNSSHRGSKPVSSKSGSKPEGGQSSKSGIKPEGKPGSRPASGVSFTRPGSGSWLLSPTFAPRPLSDVSSRGIDAELGMRPPSILVSGTGSGSGGSGSGKSGGTVYHSISSRPQTPMLAHHERELLPALPTLITLPPDLDLGDGGDTVRSVDMLDLPVPERALPFSEPVLPELALRSDTASSRATGLAIPPGLVAVPQWDRRSHTSSSNRREERDILEEEPPQAGGEWSSMRSKGSTSDAGDGAVPGTGRALGPMTRNSMGEVSQAVRVIPGDPATSETASFSSGLRRADPSSASLRPPSSLGFVLTPNVSLYASSRSDILSHSGSGSHSSRPSQHTHTTSHSHAASHPSSQESDYGNFVPSHRASLSALGGDGPPPLPLFRPSGTMQPPMEQTIEDRETEDESGATTSSRPNSGPSEITFTGTFASGSYSTGAQTMVSGVTASSEKR
ncbi:hypothetical protein JB92DRAFT_271707 [Gautieria morchelliformis]|nr:hypothetical protein JB92DRAFT_271707 [Gautieria morchelliformis]